MNSKIVKFDNKYKAEIEHIRTCVFVDEQGIDLEIDFDGLDNTASHALVFSQSNAIATGRILNDGHIGRVAVLKQYRKSGAGTSIVLALMAEAKKQNFSRIYLGSQTHAVKFYEKLGFNICSEMFIDAGINHVEMEILL